MCYIFLTPNVYPENAVKEEYALKCDICFIGRDKGGKEKLEKIASLCRRENGLYE